MTYPCIRRFHRRLGHWIGFFFLGVILVLALASLAHADTAKPTSSPQFGKSPVLRITPVTTSNQRRYRPPKTVSRPSDTILGAPHRGNNFCEPATDAVGEFTVLAPISHVGQTTSSHPTFAWFIPDTGFISLELFNPPSAKSQIFTAEVPSQPGIMLFTLPPQQLGLKPGRYRWRITLICPPNRVEAMAEFEVVKPPVNLEQRWYDTLAEALNTPSPESKDERVLSLLRDLQKSEADDANRIPDEPNNSNPWKKVLTEHSEHLKQVIEEVQQHGVHLNLA